MKTIWLAALGAIALSAYAEQAQTDSGVTLQIKDQFTHDAFGFSDQNIVDGNIRPFYALQPNPDTLYFIKGNLYSSNVRNSDETSIRRRRQAKQFAEIKELWAQHRGQDDQRQRWRVGVEKLDDLSGFWWAAPLTGASYHFDGSLLKSYVAVGDRSSYLRTDWDRDNPVDTSALYAIGQMSWQWRLDQFLIFRAAYRKDRDNNYIPGLVYGNAHVAAEPIEAGWADIEIQGEARRREDRYPRYQLEAAWAQGSRVSYDTTALPDGENTLIKERSTGDVQGFLGRFEFDYVWQADQRWLLGVEGIYASGSNNSGNNHDAGFVQTGLNVNRGELYTTHIMGALTGEALRLSLSNVQLAGVHAVFSYHDRHELVIAVRQAWRADAQGDVELNSSRIAPDGSKELGTAEDIAYDWYRPVLRPRHGFEINEFEGMQFILYAAHFEPTFPDPLKLVSGTVAGVRVVWAF